MNEFYLKTIDVGLAWSFGVWVVPILKESNRVNDE